MTAGTTPRLATVGLVPHPRSTGRAGPRHAARLDWLARPRPHGARCDEDVTAGSLADIACPRDEFTAGLDLAISLGGDGTMLRTVDLVYESGAAVLGVNVGQMGYLTEVEPAELDHALERLIAGEFEVEERMVLEVDVELADGRRSGAWWALNEAVLEKAPGAAGPPRRRDQRHVLHDLRRRRRDRRDPDRLDGLLVLGARSDRLAAAPVPPPDPGLAPHAVRPLARPRRRRGAALHRDRRAHGRRSPSTAASSACSSRATGDVHCRPEAGAHRHLRPP